MKTLDSADVLQWHLNELNQVLRGSKTVSAVEGLNGVVLELHVEDFQIDRPDHMDWYPLYNTHGAITYINFNTESSDYGTFMRQSNADHKVTRISIQEAYNGHQTCFD